MAADRELTEFNAPHLARFADLLRQADAQQRLLKLVLVAYQGGVADIDDLGASLQRVIVRPVLLREQPHLSFLLRFPTKDITKNLPVADALALIASWLAAPSATRTCTRPPRKCNWPSARRARRACAWASLRTPRLLQRARQHRLRPGRHRAPLLPCPRRPL